MDEDYIPPWRRGTITMDNGGSLPVLNSQMVQLKPRKDKRNPALDEAIEAERNQPKQRPSGHSLVR